MKKRFLRIYYSSKTPFVCLLLSWAFFCFILNGQVAEEFRAVYQLWVTAISLFVAFGLLYYEVFDKERFEAKKEMSRRFFFCGRFLPLLSPIIRIPFLSGSAFLSYAVSC